MSDNKKESFLQKAKAAIDKLPFNGWAQKIPILANISGYANYIVCVLILLIIIPIFIPNMVEAEENTVRTAPVTTTSNLDNVLKLVQKAKPVPENELIYELSKDGKYVIIKGWFQDNFSKPAVLMYPSSIEGIPVYDISFGAPYDELLAIVIPEGVLRFQNTLVASVNTRYGTIENTDLIKNLVYVSLPSTLDYHGIEDWRLRQELYNNFQNCTKLARVDMLSNYPYYIGDFSNCISLTSFTIPANVKTINESCFCASGLNSIVIPEGVKKIGASAFYWCTNLKSVTLPSTLEFIDSDAFSLCENLSEIIIPDNLTKLKWGDGVFHLTHLPLKTQARLRELGYEGEF